MKLNRFIKPAAAGLLVLGSGGIVSARSLQPEPFLQGDFAVADGPTPTSGRTPASGGLRENWHRIHDSTIGRYLQPDPVHLPFQPQASNRYGYALGSPLRNADPTGRITVVDFSGSCDDCEFDNRWAEGLRRARNVALNPRCSDFFRQFGVSLFNLLADGTPPTTVVGDAWGPDTESFGTYHGISNKIHIPCSTIYNQPAEEVARTIIHELAHYANDAASAFGSQQSTGDERLGLGEGWDAESACFGP